MSRRFEKAHFLSHQVLMIFQDAVFWAVKISSLFRAEAKHYSNVYILQKLFLFEFFLLLSSPEMLELVSRIH